jgi:LPS sulfotransferase NodH
VTDLVVASTARTGSGWLSELLGLNGLGWANEHFNPELKPGGFGAALTQGVSTEAYLEHVRSIHSRNGSFVTKLLAEWFSLMRAQMATHARDDEDMLRRLFPGASYVFLRRMDVLGSAISLQRAQKTGQWTRLRGEPALDAPAGAISIFEIHDTITWLRTHELQLRDAFAALDAPLIEVTYEGLLADPPTVICAIMDFLGRPVGGDVRVNTRHTPQASPQSVALRQAYERYRDHRAATTAVSLAVRHRRR